MGLFLVICSVASFGLLVHSLPPIESRNYTPNVGESCDFEGYSGVVTATDDCPGAASIWQYGPQAGVQCCIVASCNARGDGTYGVYTCLNTYKKDECGQGQGRFVPGYCLGDQTVQCCVDGPLPPSASAGDTTGYNYNNPNNIYDWHDPSDPSYNDPVIVPTIPTIDQDSIVVPTVPTVTNDYNNNNNNYNYNNGGGPITVPTIESPPSPQSPPSSPSPPRRYPGGGDWHKKGWGEDIASALGLTSYDSPPLVPASDDANGGSDGGTSNVYDVASSSDGSSWGGDGYNDGAFRSLFSDA